MSISSIVALFVVMLVFTLIWYGLSYLLAPTMTNPDCQAKVTGNCGDTMEICMKVENNTVVRVHHWTDGCTMSRNCIESAARLAQGKPLGQLNSLNMTDIIDDIGQVPESHLHCAQLAEITLHRAVEDFHSRDNGKTDG